VAHRELREAAMSLLAKLALILFFLAAREKPRGR